MLVGVGVGVGVGPSRSFGFGFVALRCVVAGYGRDAVRSCSRRFDSGDRHPHLPEYIHAALHAAYQVFRRETSCMKDSQMWGSLLIKPNKS